MRVAERPQRQDGVVAQIGDIALDDVLAKREQINALLRSKLDEVGRASCRERVSFLV